MKKLATTQVSVEMCLLATLLAIEEDVQGP